MRRSAGFKVGFFSFLALKEQVRVSGVPCCRWDMHVPPLSLLQTPVVMTAASGTAALVPN